MKKYFPTVFIGLGGSGTKTIQHLRKICLANPEYRDLVDRQFIFSAMDTDVDDLRAAGIPDENQVRTSENVNVARYIEDKHKQQDNDFFSWWPANTGMLNTKPLDKGAGQIRITSRLGFQYQMENNNLKDRLNSLLTKVQGITENVMPGDTMLKVYVIASLAGGTGSAISTMMGYLVHELLKGRKLDVRGVFMMPEIFCQQPQDPTLYARLRANGYAVLKELEAAISFADSDKAYVDYIPEFNFLSLPDFHDNAVQYADRYLAERPYDWCIVFDKMRDTGVSFQSPGNNYSNYYKQLAHSLYMQVFSPISRKAGSAEDNYINSLLKAVSKGEKSRRYSGFGFSALIYPQKDISNRLAHEYLVDMLGSGGYWTKADAEYQQRAGDYDRKKAEGASLAKPHRHEVFCEAVKGSLQSEYPDPFKGIVKMVDGSIGNDGKPKDPPKFTTYVDKLLKRFNDLYEAKVTHGWYYEDNGSEKEFSSSFPDNRDYMREVLESVEASYRLFCMNEITMLVNDILLTEISPGMREETRLILQLREPGASYLGIFEIRYFLSRLYILLDLLHTSLKINTAGQLQSYPQNKEKIIEALAKDYFAYRLPVLKDRIASQVIDEVSGFFESNYKIPTTIDTRLYTINSLQRDDDTGQFSETCLIKDLGSEQGAKYYDALRIFIGLLLERLSPDADNPSGLLNHVHVLFDNMGELKRKFENDLQSLRFSGKYEDYDYPDNSKVLVFSSDKAIQELKAEVKRMKSDEIVGAFYNDMSASIVDNWQTLHRKGTEFQIRGISGDETRDKLKSELRHLTDTIVKTVGDGIVEKCFRAIYSSPSVNLTLGNALQKEAELRGLFDPRDIHEFIKDKINTAFKLSAPFIRLSKGDNRVNKLEAVTCTHRVYAELQSAIEEYVKSFSASDYEGDDVKETLDNPDSRLLFYQTYLAFGLDQIDNLFFGDASLRQAYYQELQESAITPHIHKDWARELDDLDEYFNEETRAMFMLWLASGKLEKVEKETSGTTDIADKSIPVVDSLLAIDASDRKAVMAVVHNLSDPMNRSFQSDELKIRSRNLRESYKYFRTMYPAGDHSVSKKRLEAEFAEPSGDKAGWRNTLPRLLRILRAYLDDPSTNKERDNIFMEQLYNAVIGYGRRAKDRSFAMHIQGVTGEFEAFVWPKNDQ